MDQEFEARKKAFQEKKLSLTTRARELGAQHHGVVVKTLTSETVEISLPVDTKITQDLRQFLIEWVGLHYWGASYHHKVRTENGRDFHQLSCHTD